MACRLSIFLCMFMLGVHVRAQDTTILYVTAVAWSHDGQKIASVGIGGLGQQGYLHVFDVESEATILILEPSPGGFTSVDWSPDDRYLAVGSFDNTIWIIDVETGQPIQTLFGHQATVTELDWNSDGTQLVSAGNWDGRVILWDMSTYQAITTLQTPDLYTVEFGPADVIIAVGNAAGLFIFPPHLGIESFQEQNQYKYLDRVVGAIKWRSDGQRVAVGTITFDIPYAEINILDETKNPITVIATGDVSIYGLDWSNDGGLIATYSINGVVKIWDANTGLLLETYQGDTLYPEKLAFSPFGGRLAYGLSVPAEQAARGTSLADSGVAVVMPAPSLERLDAIARGCIAPDAIAGLAPISDALVLANYIAQVEALNDEQISPGCRADVLAVARAVESQAITPLD